MARRGAARRERDRSRNYKRLTIRRLIRAFSMRNKIGPEITYSENERYAARVLEKFH